MTAEADGGLGWLRAGGDPRAIGRALGARGRAAVTRHLLHHPLWHEATDARHRPAVARMAATVARRFPDILAEIEGLAEGLGLPFEPVFAWNCRGDILAQAPDGCTSVMLPGGAPVLAHNEDGFPVLRGHCFLAEIAPDRGPGLTAFCYPGSIPGHTFGWTETGLAAAVNNIRLTGVVPEVPRMVLGRAVLAAASAAEAIALLRAGAMSGGFHLCLGEAGPARLWSVEYGAGAVSAQEVTRPAAHANHALHHPAAGSGAQIVTRSSADRQARAEALLAAGADALEILHDGGSPGHLPIWRGDPADPDEENTLATLHLRLAGGAILWDVRDRRHSAPRYSGRCGPASSSVSIEN